jgi:hypothetical protein
VLAGELGRSQRRGFRRLLWPRGKARLLIPLAAFVLASCAGHVRYVSVYCLTPPQYQKLKDAEPGKVGSKLTGNAQDDLKTIAGSAIELRQYDGDLLNVLGGCVEPGK